MTEPLRSATAREAQEPLRIVTFFWSDKDAKHTPYYQFTPTHVNKLAEAFRKHLHIEHEFVCITDNPDGLDVSNIRVIPLWNEFRDLGRCFVRLGVYSRDMLPLLGPRFVQIDLDTVIVDDVTPIFQRSEPFIGYRDTKNPRCYSGAMYMMDTGSKEQVYHTFRRMYQLVSNVVPQEQKRDFFNQLFNKTSPFVGSDQSWQTEVLGEHSGLPKWGEADGIYDFWQVESLPGLPANARMVFMNGMRRDASMKEFQEKYPWVDKWWNG